MSDHDSVYRDGQRLPVPPEQARYTAMRIIEEDTLVAVISRRANGDIGVLFTEDPSPELADAFEQIARGVRDAVRGTA